MFVHYAVGSAVANRFAALGARGDQESLDNFARDAAHWTFWPSLAAAVIILALGVPLLWLFGPQFVDGYPVMLILVVGFLFRSSMGPAEFLLNMLGKQSLCAAVLVSVALLNVALNFALVPHYGLIGAATATSVALMTAALMNNVVVSRRLELDLVWRSPYGATFSSSERAGLISPAAVALTARTPTTSVQKVLNSVRGSCTSAMPMCSASASSRFLLWPGLCCQPFMTSSMLTWPVPTFSAATLAL